MDRQWTAREALEWSIGYLARKGSENPKLDAQRLICAACGIDRMQLYIDGARPLTDEERARFRNYLSRRGAGEPLQYITGEAPFRFLSVKVAPNVLIPRPETEVLVSEVLAHLPHQRIADAMWNEESQALEKAAMDELRKALRQDDTDVAQIDDALDNETARETLLIADICTGTGCIACSIASERSDTRIIATDISPDAVALARENVRRFGLDAAVSVLEGDLGYPIPECYAETFDAVISNPPYVPTHLIEALPEEVSSYEPACALDGGEDGLDVFRRLVPWSLQALKPGGIFACELHEDNLEKAADIARDAGFAQVRCVKDLAGRPRVLVAERNGK